MSEPPQPSAQPSAASTAAARPIPEGRLSRTMRLGRVAAGAAGRAALGSAVQLGRGQRPDWQGLLLSPGNIRRITDELARMRGAAMKMGQLISMDSGDMLPPELTEIMSRLRGQADFMPPAQLKDVLTRAWGQNWLRGFKTFDPRPIAAASIGQVHRAHLRDGREVAIKVQYPGVARSIDSDVANVGALMRVSGLLPRGFDLGPYLDEARAQLHEETDYAREAGHLQAFRGRIAGDPRFVLPEVLPDWSTPQVLTMTYLPGLPIEEVPQADRDRVCADLIDLTLSELLDWRLMQTDPNFANYRYDPGSGRIILLDFGATRALPRGICDSYRDVLSAGLAGQTLDGPAEALGIIDPGTDPAHRAVILSMMADVFAALRRAETYDFADTALSARLQAQGIALGHAGYVPPPLPMDVLFVQRKLGGLFLLAARLSGKVPVTALLHAHLNGGLSPT